MYDNRKQILVSDEVYSQFELNRQLLGLSPNAYLIRLMEDDFKHKHIKKVDGGQTRLYRPNELKPPCSDR